MIAAAGVSGSPPPRQGRRGRRDGRRADGATDRLRSIHPWVRRSRVPGFEHFRGFGVMTLPFDSGHVLGLRSMPQNDYAPFLAIWHRTPSGEWSMYIDGPEHDLFCPRFFGPILRHSRAASITLDWTGPDGLRVRMDDPALDWTLELTSSWVTRLINRVMPHVPLGIYRRAPVLSAIRGIADRVLGLGRMDLSGPLPNGQELLVRPRRIYPVGESRATLDGVDLGEPMRANSNPVTGEFRWPARGVLAEGDVLFSKDDPREYERRLRRFRPAAASPARPRTEVAT